jgi:hypothetical protein
VAGPPTDWAFAYAQNHRTERLDYEATDVQVTDIRGREVDADVTIRQTDSRTGEEFLEQPLGFTFVRHADEWVQHENFPIGVVAYCP